METRLDRVGRSTTYNAGDNVLEAAQGLKHASLFRRHCCRPKDKKDRQRHYGSSVDVKGVSMGFKKRDIFPFFHCPQGRTCY